IINTKMPPVDNVLVRKAIAAAINRSEIAEKVFFNTMTALYSLIPAGMWGRIDAFKEAYGEGPNITLARSLLSQAGYSETSKLVIELWYTPTHYGDTEADVATLLKK
ncbi:MAG: ABC transporter substrate-binding protein, partial [Thermosphaera sp.]|nr:ABC transporter substrate-binding protein [Thermosphaera sp.]